MGLSKFIGQHHMGSARSIVAPRVDIDACVPGSPENFSANRRIALSMGFDASRIYCTIPEMIAAERDKIRFVIVATPNDKHLEHASLVAEGGLDLILDKPVGRTAAEADGILAAVKRAGIRSCVTATYCGHSALIEARDIVLHGGHSSKLLGGRMTYDQRWLRKKLADMREEDGLAEAVWRKSAEKSGKAGSLGDIMSHLLFALHFITGQKFYSAWGHRRWVVEGSESRHTMTDDHCTAMVTMDNGAEITLESTQYAGGHQNDIAIELWFSDGRTLMWNKREPDILVWCDSAKGNRQILTGDDFRSPLHQLLRTMPSMHGDGWKDANARLIASYAIGALGLPGKELGFHPDVLAGRNVNATIDAIVQSSEASTPRQLVGIDWKE